MKIAAFLLPLAALFLTSCSEEIDLTAPYKETSAIYGLLNANDSIQYIRVSKAFLGDGNVYVMAQQQDSVTYGDILQVYLQRLVNGVVRDSFPLTRVESIPKDSGSFYYPGQVYYQLNHLVNDPSSFYRLTVFNTLTGYTARSATQIIPDIAMYPQSPLYFNTDADFATPLPITYKFTASANSSVFDMDILFRFREIDASGSISYDSVIIPFNERFAAPMELVEFQYYRPDFFVALGQSIPVKPGVTRRVDQLQNGKKAVEFRFYCGTEELYTYYQVTQPSGGIVQERPLFTNIDNGVGLFTSRLIHSELRNLSANTRAVFDTSTSTKDLNFIF
jgi:hypothetical protein